MREFYPDLPYLVTISTWRHLPILNSFEKKQVILNKITQAKNKFHSFEFFIMRDHIHLYFAIESVQLIPKIVQCISGGASYELHRKFLLNGRIFEKSHLTYIRNELGADRAKGYVIGNPIKHGEVNKIVN